MYQGSEGGTLCPPKYLWVREFQFFWEKICLGVIYHIQKDSWSLDAQNPPKKVFDLWNFCLSKWRLSGFVRVPPNEILVFPTNFIFFQGNEITLRGKKCTALFQTHNWEKSNRVKRLKFWKSGFLAQKSPNITQNLGRKIVIYSSFWIGMAYIVAW